MLDELLRPGIAGLSERFTAAQVRFVAGCQQPDGGFGGRQGSSDPYFTDFALRTLAWLAPGHAAFDRAAGYLAHSPCPARRRRMLQSPQRASPGGTAFLAASPAARHGNLNRRS